MKHKIKKTYYTIAMKFKKKILNQLSMNMQIII